MANGGSDVKSAPDVQRPPRPRNNAPSLSVDRASTREGTSPMSLAIADGPLSAHPADSNYEIEGPAHKIFWHPITRRIRAELAGETVADTREARLLYETGYRARLYVPLADVRSDAVEPSERTSYCPFKGTAS